MALCNGLGFERVPLSLMKVPVFYLCGKVMEHNHFIAWPMRVQNAMVKKPFEREVSIQPFKLAASDSNE